MKWHKALVYVSLYSSDLIVNYFLKMLAIAKKSLALTCFHEPKNHNLHVSMANL